MVERAEVEETLKKQQDETEQVKAVRKAQILE